MKLIIAIFVTALLFVASIKAQDEWATADTQTVRLAPNKFSRLPRKIVNDLEKRGYTIPQYYDETTKHNVVQGEFKQKGRKDWAILCSRNRTSAILIYWNGSTKGVSRIASGYDKDYLQTIGGGRIGFSRVIGVANAKYIIDHYKSYGGPKPPKISHNGIEDAFAEKASEILYLHRGKWLRLQGAD